MSNTIDERLQKLKEFISDKYLEERLNPVITTRFRIEVPIKTVTELFLNDNITFAILNLKQWLNKEFPKRSCQVYLEDSANTNVYIELE